MRYSIRTVAIATFFVAVSIAAYFWVVPSRVIHNDPSNFAQLTDLSVLYKFLAKIPAQTTCIVFEGLPHQLYAADDLASEIRRTDTIQRGGYDFYATPLQIEPTDLVRIVNLVTSHGTYEEWLGEKFCGGFHPDFTAIFTCPGGEIEVQICFGCDEAKIYSGSSYIRSDLNNSKVVVLQEILDQYNENWPR